MQNTKGTLKIGPFHSTAYCLDCHAIHPATYFMRPNRRGDWTEADWTRGRCEPCRLRFDAEEQERETERRRKAERDRRERAVKTFERICPTLYRQSDTERFPADAWRIVAGWRYAPAGLLLMGPSGTCKTRMLWQRVKALMIDEGKTVVAYNAVEFANAASSAFFAGASEGERFTNKLCNAGLVFLDDLGKQRLTERVESTLYGTIEYRTANGLPTFVSTNLNRDALLAKFSEDRGEPMARRLREFCVIVGLDEGGRVLTHNIPQDLPSEVTKPPQREGAGLPWRDI